MRDFGAVLAVVHEEKVKIPHVVHDELQETVRQQVTSLLGRAITDVRHRRQALKLTALTRVNTLRASP